MKGKGYITFMVAAALSMGFAVTAMAEEPGGGEPGGAQLGTMIEMADRLAPEGEDAAVIRRGRIFPLSDTYLFNLLTSL